MNVVRNLQQKLQKCCHRYACRRIYYCTLLSISDLKFVGRVAHSVQRLTTGWTVRGSNPGGARFFARPNRPWGPPSLLYNGYQVFPGRAADHSPSSSAVVMEEQSYNSTHPLGHNRACNVNPLPLPYLKFSFDSWAPYGVVMGSVFVGFHAMPFALWAPFLWVFMPCHSLYGLRFCGFSCHAIPVFVGFHAMPFAIWALFLWVFMPCHSLYGLRFCGFSCHVIR